MPLKTRMQEKESMLAKIQMKNKSLNQKLRTILQLTDTSNITQTVNFILYSLGNPSVSGNSSDDENEHP